MLVRATWLGLGWPALVAAVCGCRAPAGPAWPASAGRAVVADWRLDGGESLDPRSTIDLASSGEDSYADGAIDAAIDLSAVIEIVTVPGAAPAVELSPPPTGATTGDVELNIEEINVGSEDVELVK